MLRNSNRPARCAMLLALLLAALSMPPPAIARTDAEQARQLIERGQIPEARRALEAELRKHPRNIEARYTLAVLLEDINHASEAETLYLDNLKRSWHLPSLINLAALLQQKGEMQGAIDWLTAATRHLRHEAAPWYLLAEISEQRGDLKQAGEQFELGIRADPLNGFVWLRFALFQASHHLSDGGIKYGKKAMRLLADCAVCWHKFGDIMVANQRDRDALTAYQRSLALHPSSETRQLLINTLRRLGENERADRMQQALDAWRKHQTQ